METTRLKKLRLARGLSLDALVAKMGGLVSKQAISKYERGLSNPSPLVLVRLAKALEIKTVDLWAEPAFQIEYVAFRKKSRLGAKEVTRLQSCCDLAIERRMELQNLFWPDIPRELLQQKITSLDQAEEVAKGLRQYWELGVNPIAHLVDTLESNFVHVIEISGDNSFDGWSARVKVNGRVAGRAVISRQGTMRERQRFNLAHELGHLVCDPQNVDEEKVAHRFAGAFLAPAEAVIRDTGPRRTNISLQELVLLAKKYGISTQATIHRLRDLGIITDAQYTSWFKFISMKGWRKCEPWQTPPEQSYWVQRTASRALAEGLIDPSVAGRFHPDLLEDHASSGLEAKREFLKLSIAERRKILQDQASKAADYYAETLEDVAEADFDDYKR